jgi:hypothetical protein
MSSWQLCASDVDFIDFAQGKQAGASLRFVMGQLWRKSMKQVGLGKVAIAVSAFACATMISIGWSEQGGVSLSVESAQARVGRPLTPVSVAGVARRQTRRAVYGAGVVGAGVVGAGAYYAGRGYYGAGPYAAYGNGYGYNGWDDYARRNGFVCRPGTTFKGEDGLQHLCQ